MDPELGGRRDEMILANQLFGRPTHEFGEHGIGVGNMVVLNHEQPGLSLVQQVTRIGPSPSSAGNRIPRGCGQTGALGAAG